jgi:hypothetical protein
MLLHIRGCKPQPFCNSFPSLFDIVSTGLQVDHSPAKSLFARHSLVLQCFGVSTLVTWSINIDSHSLAIMYAVVLILISFLVSLVSSAYVAPRDGTYLDLERTNKCTDIRQNVIILPLRQPTHRPRCRKLLTPCRIQRPNNNVK